MGRNEKHKRNIPIDELKLLLARSGNQCAFPDCDHPIFDDNNIFIAQLCHIESVSPKGQRYNPNKSSNEINSYDNLLFLCYRHHKVTDDVNSFPVNKLIEIKTEHENKFKESVFKYSKIALAVLIAETQSYWIKIEKLQEATNVPNYRVPINASMDILELIHSVKDFLYDLKDISVNLMQDRHLRKKHFDYVCLGFPNTVTHAKVTLDQIEIKYLEEQLLNNPNSEEIKNKLHKLRVLFAETAQKESLAD